RYTDPDGEWVHLVIGAVVGGVSGLIEGLNAGAEGSKLWGYMVVGAASGALSAGIGAGVNSALAGGSFRAGFIGTARTSSTGFFAGFLTGVASGATNGLITGTGYGLLQGKDVGKAFSDGLTQAGLQGMSSGTVGGVLGGFDAISNDRHFLTGTPRTNKQYIMGNNKINSLTDYSDGKDVTRRHYTSPVANGQDEVTMMFKAPSGYRMTNNFRLWDIGTASAPYSTVLNGNKLTLKFALPSNSLRVGVVITKNFEQNLGQYIHAIKNSSYSWTYWMLSLLHLKQY
ncbi:MAG TPA: hypothetical protein DEG71_03160, partial [Clostridiales bacterium]|nr:hypothetical protein [Clostridiales bacterium]